jgi:quinol monooxygenase YgiN
MTRRGAIAGGIAIALAGPASFASGADGTFGMIGKITAKPGERDALVRLLLGGTGDMPGCRAYLVAEDRGDANAIWVTEAWDSEASHKTSLTLSAVRAAIARAMPLIASFDTVATTRPVERA